MTVSASFGVHSPGASYATRRSVYAVVQRDNGEIAVVETGGGYYLPGGGLEAGETAEAALSRECLEECGTHIQIGAYLGDAEQYLDIPDEGLVRVVGSFFLGQFGEPNFQGYDPTHSLLWLPALEAAAHMKRPFESWAILRATNACYMSAMGREPNGS
jgi:8-oxo-dGTP diphosphatase